MKFCTKKEGQRGTEKERILVTAEDGLGHHDQNRQPHIRGAILYKWSKTFNRNENVLLFPIDYNCGFKNTVTRKT